MTSTRVAGRFALRIVVLNHATTQAHVDRVLDLLEHEPVDAAAEVAPGGDAYDISQDAGASYVRGGTFAGVDLASLRIFAGLTAHELGEIERIGVERRVPAGEALIQRWETTRELLVILEGTVEVQQGEHRRPLGAGDIVGEIAALGWQGGFSYPRTATVVASSAVRLMVIPGGAVAGLTSAVPVLGQRLRASARERLQRM